MKTKLFLAYSLSMLLAVPPGWSQGTAPTPYAAAMEAGQSHYNKQQYQAAKTNFDNALVLCPNPSIDGPQKGDSLLWAGFTETKLGNLQTSLSSFQKAVSCTGLAVNKRVALADGCRQLANAAMSSGQWEIAQNALDLSSKDLNQLPDSVNKNRLLLNIDASRANLYEKEGKFDLAETTYKQVLTGEETEFGKLSLQYGIILHNIGMLKTREGDWKAAVKLYTEALNCYDSSKIVSGPDLLATWEHLAEAQLKCLQNADAQQSYKQAIILLEKERSVDEIRRAKESLRSLALRLNILT